MELKNKVALVTGGTKGIGKAIAKALVEAGVRVVVTARHEDQVHEAVESLKSVGSSVEGFPCDVEGWIFS